jgi:hypothetical protein
MKEENVRGWYLETRSGVWGDGGDPQAPLKLLSNASSKQVKLFNQVPPLLLSLSSFFLSVPYFL